MQDFNIRVLKRNPIKFEGETRQPGKITIGNFSERFWMALSYWNLQEYKKQWEEGIQRLKTHDSSCLVVKIRKIDTEVVVSAWVLYKQGDTIIFQYHFLPDEEMAVHLPPFDTKTWYMHIRPRSNELEEWKIPAKDFFASWHAHSHPNKK